MANDFILNLFVLFFIYSFIGWIWETIYESILNKKLLNRGFLVGPYIPIYGFAGLIFFNFLQRFQTDKLISIETLKVFVFSALGATILEYVTSYTLEKLLNARWWDYSNYPLNLNGRICVLASLFWGFVSVAVINIVNPRLVLFLGFMERDLKLILSSSLTTVFCLDLILTINSIVDLHNKLKLIIVLEANKTLDVIRSISGIKDKFKNLTSPFTMRIVESFPKMRFSSEQMQNALQKLRELVQDKHK